jgi:hypothetical protein
LPDEVLSDRSFLDPLPMDQQAVGAGTNLGSLT